MHRVERVEGPVVNLAQVFNTMSHHWANGLLWLSVFYMVRAMAETAIIINGGFVVDWLHYYAVWFGLAIPYMIMQETAVTTLGVVHIFDALNGVRGRYGPSAHMPVFWLEHFLRNLTHGALESFCTRELVI